MAGGFGEKGGGVYDPMNLPPWIHHCKVDE